MTTRHKAKYRGDKNDAGLPICSVCGQPVQPGADGNAMGPVHAPANQTKRELLASVRQARDERILKGMGL